MINMKENKFDLNKVQFSRNDVELGIKIPEKLTKALAYEIGIHIGDGHLKIFKRSDGWAYLNVFSGDYNEEMDFYQDIVKPLIFRLYNKEVKIKKSTKNTLQIPFKSKAISTFKRDVLKLPSGKKKGNVIIPDIIMKSKMRKYCLQGIIDTDFSLSFRHGKYPKITGTLQEADEKLKDQIMEIFKDLGINAICSISKRKDDRVLVKSYKEFRIDVNGRENLDKWLNVVGFNNPKHLTKLRVWKEIGYCKPLSKITERKLIASVAQSVER